MSEHREMTTDGNVDQPPRTPISHIIAMLMTSLVFCTYSYVVTRKGFCWQALMMSSCLWIACGSNLWISHRQGSGISRRFRIFAWMYALMGLAWIAQEWHSNLRFLFN